MWLNVTSPSFLLADPLLQSRTCSTRPLRRSAPKAVPSQSLVRSTLPLNLFNRLARTHLGCCVVWTATGSSFASDCKVLVNGVPFSRKDRLWTPALPRCAPSSRDSTFRCPQRRRLPRTSRPRRISSSSMRPPAPVRSRSRWLGSLLCELPVRLTSGWTVRAAALVLQMAVGTTVSNSKTVIESSYRCCT